MVKKYMKSTHDSVRWSSRGGTGTLPPPPSSNRTCGFPASGLPEFDQPAACTGCPAWPAGPVRSVFGRWYTVIGLPQADLRSDSQDVNPAGALRSTGVTPLPRYYDPLRLPPEPGDGYEFPPSVAAHRETMPAARMGLPGSSADLCRHPPSPTTPESPAAASARCLAVRMLLRIR